MKFEIVESERIDTETSSFVVRVLEGNPEVGLFFAYEDSAGPWEYRIVGSYEQESGLIRLRCFNWVVRDGHGVGQILTTFSKSKRETERYDRAMAKAGVRLG